MQILRYGDRRSLVVGERMRSAGYPRQTAGSRDAMKRFTCLALLVLGLACRPSSNAGQADAVRQPAVAGSFYPGDAARLKAAIKEFLHDARPVAVEQPVAIVVPHAGWAFAGQVIADAFKSVEGQKYDTVVIMGTNHTTAGFRGISVYPHGAFRTPLGNASIDEEVARALLAEDKSCNTRQDVHVREHSVEVQIPFVQYLFPSAKIVPVIVGEPDPDQCAAFGEALAKVLRGRRALIVASSDLSHYPTYQDAVSTDRQTLEAIVAGDPRALHSKIEERMSEGIRELGTCACGEGAIMSAMTAAKALGASRGVFVSYTNSASSLSWERPRSEPGVVGYGAVVFCGGRGQNNLQALKQPAVASPNEPLTAADKKTLLGIARKAINRYLVTDTLLLVRDVSPTLQRAQGAFVTLKEEGELRGCIGHMMSELPLAQTVGTVALLAAFNDTRFSKVTASEVPGLEIEISVLTPMKPVSRIEDIVIGRDGVYMQKGDRSAVFLPQVAPEQGWGRTEMLQNLSVKAGLPSDAWKSGAKFLVFQAEVFSEHQFK